MHLKETYYTIENVGSYFLVIICINVELVILDFDDNTPQRFNSIIDDDAIKLKVKRGMPRIINDAIKTEISTTRQIPTNH